MKVKIIRCVNPLYGIWYMVKYRKFIFWHTFPVPFSEKTYAVNVAEYISKGGKTKTTTTEEVICSTD